VVWISRSHLRVFPVLYDTPLYRLKVIIVQQSLEMGGAERQGLMLARWLQENHGADVEVWGLKYPGTAARWCDEHDINWRHVPWEWSGGWCSKFMGLFRFLVEMRRSKPVVLLPFTMPPNVVCGVLWRLAGSKTCIWNQRDEGRQRFVSWLERHAVMNTPWFVTNSTHASEFLTGGLGVAGTRINIIPNGIDLSPPKFSRDEWRCRLGIAPESMVACMVANLHAFKDHTTLLNAWARVKEVFISSPPILLLAGHDYGVGDQLKSLAGQLGLTGQVHFLGHVDDIAGLLSASDIGVYSSMKEGVPNAVLECMAAGLPVVATDIPGNREALGEGNGRFLVEPQDSVALATGVLDLLKDHELRRTTGVANYERVLREFGKERMLEKYYDCLVKALGQGHRH